MNARTYPQNQTISPPDGHWLRYLTSWLQSSENFQPQWHASTTNQLYENSTKPLKRFSSLSDDFLGGVCEATKKSCDFGGSRFSSESAEQNVRFNRDPEADDHLINLLPPPCDCESCPLTNRVVGKVTPHPAATPGKGKSVPFVCYFCLFVCV